jgi:hypothetical protein
MKKYFVLLLLPIMSFVGCEKDSEFTSIKNIKDVGLKVSFGNTKAARDLKSTSSMTYETPENYYVALKKVTLIAANGTSDYVLFNEPDLASSFVFDYTDDNIVHSLLDDSDIPDGEYTSIELEIYYLQMNIAIATGERGIERRNIRIYLSDDAETEDGLHQPGDMTQINGGQETGWLLGEGQTPNMDPVSPRVAAYTDFGEGIVWYDFAGKSGKDYGPFGDIDFMNNSTHPIYSTIVNFNFVDNKGSNLVLDFNVNNCWQFEDKSGDGVFGAEDLDPVNPTKWHMALPEMTVTLE